MYNLTELRQETDEIIENLLADGSDPEALYIIEHHVAHYNFDKLEKLVVDAYKLGYEISEAEEVEEDGKQGIMKVFLKYGKNNERVITGLKRISKPGLRVYAKTGEVPKVLNGLGIAIVSTSEGVITDKEARAKNVGGEVLAYVW